ncbi:MAG: biopolymer transporter ExbD [Opitutales bacterium]|nr:biopolymer transporter ExbD [Opitutales bacterium]
MSRRNLINKGEDKTDINISPMIDMVFILLIFFIVTTVFVDERGIGVDRPQPNPDTERDEDRDPMIFRLTATGQILHDGANISLSRVENVVRVTRSQFPDLPVILQVERNARSGLMIQVMDFARQGDREVPVTVTAVD